MLQKFIVSYFILFPDFSLAGIVLKVCTFVEFLGHYTTDDLANDMDINRQCRLMYAQANTHICKFSMCSVSAKVALFKAYCTPFYTAHLWRRYRQGSM